jgi:ABC-type Zn uptake system ZnuABC Zn-binding protein ZnuA
MVQFLKSILSGNKKAKVEILKKQLKICNDKIDTLEKNYQEMTETIKELSYCITTVADAAQYLAQDVSAIAQVMEAQQKDRLDDRFLTSGSDDDDDGGYLH